jgi:hypothetical protein
VWEDCPAGTLEWQPGGEVRDLDRYEERFEQVLASVNRGWVNLSATTIREAMLIVAVEWIQDRSALVVAARHGEVESLEPLGVEERVDRGDLSVGDGERHHRVRPAV